MAIFHLSVKTISRSAGRSSTAAAAYRAGVEITDRQTGEVHDYRRKSGIESAELFLPAGAPEWATDRAELWNAAEVSEKRKNSTVAREFEVALPAELSADQRRDLAHNFTKVLVKKYGFAADCAIHLPGKGGDSKNHHAHILCSTRKLTAEGFTAKTRELDDRATGAAQVVECRELFANMTNAALERAGHIERVDHRSLEAQGIDREAGIHLGPTATAMERRGEVSEKTMHHQERQAEAAGKVAALVAIAETQAKAAQKAQKKEKKNDTKQHPKSIGEPAGIFEMQDVFRCDNLHDVKHFEDLLQQDAPDLFRPVQTTADHSDLQQLDTIRRRIAQPIEARSAKEVWAASPNNPINQDKQEVVVMATQAQHNLVAAVTEQRKKYGYRHPSKEVLTAVDEALIDQARERLGIPLQQPREAVPTGPSLADLVKASFAKFVEWITGNGGKRIEIDLQRSEHYGPVVQLDALHAVQRVGGGTFAIHQLDHLDKLPGLDDPQMEIKYRDGVGQVIGKLGQAVER